MRTEVYFEHAGMEKVEPSSRLFEISRVFLSWCQRRDRTRNLRRKLGSDYKIHAPMLASSMDRRE